MTFLEKLDYLMNRDGLNKHTLAQQSGIPYTTIVGFYKRSYGDTKLSTIQKLCVFFNVSLDYMAKDDYTNPYDSPSAFTADEIQLIDTYRAADPVFQAAALAILKEHPAKSTAQSAG